ncbi:MAG TPA: hypothetical protein PK736_06725 [Bacteroidia bacterium]|nr:hypothetical protein [Bacteroidia bacterium]
MKKINLFTTVAAILIALNFMSVQNANARIWRINVLSNYQANGPWGDNFGGNASNPVFKNIGDAHSNTNLVQNGDTLYLEGCPQGVSFPGVTITRPLVIIGTGYYLTINANTSNDLLQSRLVYIYFNAGSAGSQIIGVELTGSYNTQVNTDNITIKRCYINSSTNIFVLNNVKDININQNFFDNTNSNTNSGITFSSYNAPGAGLTIRNNIFKRTLLVRSGNTIYDVAKCDNNIFDCPYLAGGSVIMKCASFKNNIIKTPAITLNINEGISSSKVAYNTIATQTQLDTAAGYNNKYLSVANMSNLFVTPTASIDGNYRTKGNIYDYKGNDNAPRGAFGGASVTARYTLSGNAAIPIVYDISTTGVATQANGLQVIIKARSIK